MDIVEGMAITDEMQRDVNKLWHEMCNFDESSLLTDYDTDYIEKLYKIICDRSPGDRKRVMFTLAKYAGNIAICERLGLGPTQYYEGEIIINRGYRKYDKKLRKFIGYYPRHPAFTKWLHEVKGYPMSYQVELEDIRTPVDEWMLKYMRERYDAGAEVEPLRVGNSHSTWLRTKGVSPTLVRLIKKYNIPIHKYCIDKYETRRRKVKGGLWDARRDLVLWRRTIWT